MLGKSIHRRILFHLCRLSRTQFHIGLPHKALLWILECSRKCYNDFRQCPQESKNLQGTRRKLGKWGLKKSCARLKFHDYVAFLNKRKKYWCCYELRKRTKKLKFPKHDLRKKIFFRGRNFSDSRDFFLPVVDSSSQKIKKFLF